jgi:hypothetical protein
MDDEELLDFSELDITKYDYEKGPSFLEGFFEGEFTILHYIVICVLILLLLLVLQFFNVDINVPTISSMKGQMAIASKNESFISGPYPKLILVFLFMIYNFAASFFYTYKRGKWRSNKPHIRQLISIRQQFISGMLGRYGKLNERPSYSIINSLSVGATPYNSIQPNRRALVNWRPLTTRLPGYLGGGGSDATLDGVFYMNEGITRCLERGVRGFFFDIDYLDASPCNPAIIFRDDGGVMRSLNTGSLNSACRTLSQKAFTSSNKDPIMIFIYFRRIPPGEKQKEIYFKSVANSLFLLSGNFLKDLDGLNFHSCANEQQLITNTPIHKLESKFIICMNLNTNSEIDYPRPRNLSLKDNLHYYNNIRMYSDSSYPSSGMGDVLKGPLNGIPSCIKLTNIDQIINLSSTKSNGANNSPLSTYQNSAMNTFYIALTSPQYDLTATQLNTLLNTNGTQCVPLNVLNLSVSKEYAKTMAPKKQTPSELADLTSLTNIKDPLSIWTYNGWSPKNLQ